MNAISNKIMAGILVVLTGVWQARASSDWKLDTGTWDDAGATHWTGGVPGNGTTVNLMQNTVSPIIIDYNAGAALTGDDTTIGTRFGVLTLQNTGVGGSTTLKVGANANKKLPTGDLNVNTGGILQVSDGLVSPLGSLNVTNGTVNQSGGLVKPLYYDINVSGTGVYSATGGTVNARQLILSGSGAFSMGSGVTLDLTRQNQYLYVQNSATFTNTGGTILGSPTLYISGGSYTTSGSTYNIATTYQTGGTININSGTITHYYQVEVGKDAGQTATFNYAGGSFTPGLGLNLGSNGGTGTFNQAGNLTTRWINNNGVSGWLYIGGTSGQGTYNLGDASGAGTITTIGSGGLQVGQTGTLHGRGSINTDMYAGTQNSGKVIADGFGSNSDLDLSGLGKHYAGYGPTLANPVDNPSGGTAGWYAVNKGRLLFPTLGGAADNWQDATTIVRSSNGSTYNIGESKYSVDPTLDLVNSSQLAFAGLSNGASGTLAASLLSPDRTDVPLGQYQSLSAVFLAHCLDVFQFTGSNFTFTSAGLSVRYDDALATTLGIPENLLNLYHYNAGTSYWELITAGSANTSAHILTGKSVNSLGLFAVGVLPEPTTGLLLALASGLLVLWRGRRSDRFAV